MSDSFIKRAMGTNFGNRTQAGRARRNHESLERSYWFKTKNKRRKLAKIGRLTRKANRN